MRVLNQELGRRLRFANDVLSLFHRSTRPSACARRFFGGSHLV
jgi:hypothetical protein